MSHNLNIELSPRTDSAGKTYYVGKIKVDALLNMGNGVTFLVFVSDEGEEQLQIAPFNDRKERV